MNGEGKKRRLSTRVIGGYIALGILITAASCIIGYYRYTMVIEQMYNDKAYNIAYSAMEYIDGDAIEKDFKLLRTAKDADELAKVAQDIMAEEEYQRVLNLLNALRDNMGANYIYIADQTDGNGNVISQLMYLMDAENPDDAYPAFVPGDTSPMNESFLKDSEYIYETGNRSDNYFYSHSAFGYNTSAIAAIRNSDGKVIGIIGVEIAMTNLQTARQKYILYTVLLSMLITVCVVLAYLTYIRRFILKPIKLITDETDDFVRNETQISQRLETVRTGDEIENLAHSIFKMENNIKTYIENLTTVTAEKERIGAELSIATQIQADMLPSIFPAFPERKELDIYATMNPAKEVGGDFYDFFMVDNRHLAIVMADVSGKGVPAALFMVIGKTLIKDHTKPNTDLGEVFTEVNNLLCESNNEGLFITAFEGVLDLVTGQFNYVNAGHEIPFIYRKEGKYEPYKIRPGFVLAGMEGMRYQAGSMTLGIGDKIFQYTDGVTEATNANGERYGMNRLQTVLDACGDKTPEELLPIVKADIDNFVGEAPQFDDITMLCMEYRAKMIPNEEDSL